MNETVLWDYPKSSASYRVRIALNLAGIAYRTVIVDLLDGGHKAPEHLARNPQGLVPVLEIDGHRLTQSLAILDYLDTTRALHLLPKDPVWRARVQAAAHAIAVDLHPVCNLSVMRHATGGQEPARTEWMQHFIRPGLVACEALLNDLESDGYVAADTPSLIDLCLIPQLYNANRWGVAYDDLNRITQIEARCAAHPAFVKAAP